MRGRAKPFFGAWPGDWEWRLTLIARVFGLGLADCAAIDALGLDRWYRRAVAIIDHAPRLLGLSRSEV